MKKACKKLIEQFIGLLFILMRVFPICKNKVVVSSFCGKGYGDSSKYICENLIKSEIKIKVVWLVQNKTEKSHFPKEIKIVKNKSLSAIYQLATAKVWLDNCRKDKYTIKRSGQYYIQLWHSCLRLKKIEKDAEAMLPKAYVEKAVADSKNIDLITSGCEFSTRIYKNSFWYNGEILECGTPRCDMFFDYHKIKTIKEDFIKKYGIDQTTKILLYAPTFRKNNPDFVGNLNFQKFIDQLNECGKYVLLVRFHPITKTNVHNSKNVIDISKYPDMQELITICDFLITDYSGCCFDAMIANKPCILYSPDLEQYLKEERGLYFDYNKLPFIHANSEKTLIDGIVDFDMLKYEKGIKEFDKIIGLKETGEASKTIAKKIIEVINDA